MARCDEPPGPCKRTNGSENKDAQSDRFLPFDNVSLIPCTIRPLFALNVDRAKIPHARVVESFELPLSACLPAEEATEKFGLPQRALRFPCALRRLESQYEV